MKRSQKPIIVVIGGLICGLLPANVSGGGSSAGVMDDQILEAVRRHEASIIEHRHQIHQNPELGVREFETSKRVADHLRALHMEVRTGIAHTGVVGLMTGGKPGPVIAVRADMDALPITEKTDLPFKSTRRTTVNGVEVGVMHACGHDVHTAVLMGVASVLNDLKAEIPGTLMFIFQPAEEGPPPGGARMMLEEGLFDNPRPETIYGLHTRFDLPVGHVGYAIGPMLAAVDIFEIEIIGRQTHAAAPHKGIDPIVMAAQAVMALQTIPSRSLNPIQPAVVTVGTINGGVRWNIIPETVRMEGTVRTYDPEVRDAIERRMDEILKGITSAGGGAYRLRYQRDIDAVVNDPDLSRQVVSTLVAVLGEKHVHERPPSMGGEDFANYTKEVPGFFYWLGTTKEGTESGPAHSPTFRADDGAMPVGMRIMSNILIDDLMRRAGGGDR